MNVPDCIRAQRLEHMLSEITTWQRSHGAARACARYHATYAIHEFRKRHLTPERLAFEGAVQRRRAAVVTEFEAAAVRLTAFLQRPRRSQFEQAQRDLDTVATQVTYWRRMNVDPIIHRDEPPPPEAAE